MVIEAPAPAAWLRRILSTPAAMLTHLPSPVGCHDRAVLLYEYVGKRTVDLQHTEVPDAYRGRGIAKHLAKVGRVAGPLASLSLFLGQSANGSHPAASLQLGVGEGCGEGAARGGGCGAEEDGGPWVGLCVWLWGGGAVGWVAAGGVWGAVGGVVCVAVGWLGGGWLWGSGRRVAVGQREGVAVG